MWTTLKGGIAWKCGEFFSASNREQLRDDFFGCGAIPVGSEPLPIRARVFTNCSTDRVWVRCNEPVGASLHRFNPLGAVAQSDTGDTQVKSFFLNAAGVRQDFARMLFESEHLEMALRIDWPDVSV